MRIGGLAPLAARDVHDSKASENALPVALTADPKVKDVDPNEAISRG